MNAKLSNSDKLKRLLTGLKRKPENLIEKDGKLYKASWEINYHNGNIEDYEETPLTEEDERRFLANLEKSYLDQEWQEYQYTSEKLFKSGAISRLYD